jgi:hypothetical protein
MSAAILFIGFKSTGCPQKGAAVTTAKVPFRGFWGSFVIGRPDKKFKQVG